MLDCRGCCCTHLCMISAHAPTPTPAHFARARRRRSRCGKKFGLSMRVCVYASVHWLGWKSRVAAGAGAGASPHLNAMAHNAYSTKRTCVCGGTWNMCNSRTQVLASRTRAPPHRMCELLFEVAGVCTHVFFSPANAKCKK